MKIKKNKRPAMYHQHLVRLNDEQFQMIDLAYKKFIEQLSIEAKSITKVEFIRIKLIEACK